MADNYQGSQLQNRMLRLWWVVALGIGAGVSLAILALLVVQPTYSATATQLVKGKPGVGAGANYQAAQFAESRATSYPAFLLSPTILQRVRVELDSDYTDVELREQLSAANPEGTPLVKVTATGRSAQEAQNLANTASRQLARFITDIEVVDGRSPVEVEIAVEAGLPPYPSFPSKSLFLAMGASAGAAVGLVAALILGGLPARRNEAQPAGEREALPAGEREALPA